ncbi:MAG: GNAT family N-acetyltransferase [Planctomycetes bacterium]|nr:GNAT family N-acetyltransferase [Planctomycetota bacterium]
MITNFQKQYASQVAGLHISGISNGFISSLGQGFVTALYEAIAEDENSFGFVAVEDGEVLGFVAFTTGLSKLYKYVALKKGLKFGFILVRKMTSLGILKKIWSNIFYPGKMKSLDLPDAELLSIVIAPQGRGKGLATQLVGRGFEECASRGIGKVKVLVDAANELANKLYLKCGFKLAGQIDSHGVISNIYVAQIN